VRKLAAIVLATGLGAGFAPLAPGTFGAALAIPIFVLLSQSFWGLSLAWGALLAAGTWAAGEAERAFGSEDDGRIVIDEVVGQLLALAPLFTLPAPVRTNSLAVVTGFVAFRAFDIAKPGPVRWAERRFRGGLGVMADDVVAGALAAVIVAAGIAAGVLA
jgi:phosphatidylglycerophosphatase A